MSTLNDIAAIKSTVDKWGLAIAQTALNSQVALDLDDRALVQSVLMEGSEDALAWKLMDFSSTERQGISNFAIAMGSAVQHDANNIKALTIAGEVNSFFCAGKTLPVFNYLADDTTNQDPPVPVEYPEVGRFAIRNVDMNPQVSDSLTGYRLVVVEGFLYFHPSYYG